MNGVEIINGDIVKENEKGTVFEFDNRDSKKFLLIKRKKGTVSGEHYHTGKNPFKNPETLIILEGEVEVYFKNIYTQEAFRKVYTNPVMFKLAPFIYHEIIACTDIVMLDMNGITSDVDDTIKGKIV